MDNYEHFREKLDQEHQWPTIYMFKFVVPKASEAAVRELFRDEALQTRDSRKGNFVAFTMKKMIYSSDEVVAIYEEASKITGLIAL